MKKIIIIAAAALMSISSFAQKAGELYVEGTVGLGFTSTTSKTTVHGVTNTNSNAYGFIDLAPGVGYFVTDNLAVNGRVGFSLYGGDQTTLSIAPGVSYYLKLVDKIYYAPGINLGLSLGFLSSNVVPSFRLTAGLGTFEYRATEHIGVYANCLTLNYNLTTQKTDIPGTDEKMSTANHGVGMNLGASFGVKYFF